MNKELSKTYDPNELEDRIYNFWNQKGYFHAEPDETKKPFSIVIPPPNVTGQLHMGHALNNTLQDIIIRTKRMQGYSVCWLPGTDHAGIATQIKVEQNLREEKGLTRHDIGREEFLKLAWEWKEKYGGRIIEQLKKLGSSCDWEREAFTMSPTLSAAVKKTFVELYNKELIYQGFRIINWCPECNTALSDAEVEHKEIEGSFWYIKYPVKGQKGRYVTIATTRPETMLGDTAVAVNPEDERYKDIIGKTLILPFIEREIPVVADEYVDKEFGTGCVKITPGHDPNDFEVGERHNLETILILDGNGKVNENGGKFCGMDRFEARKQIISELKELGLLIKIEKHTHNVAHCYRCGTMLEPMASKQWFVKMPPLAKPAIDVVKNGEIRFIPDRFSKIYLNWMENIHDWCISRQLWWGHRIPAYYCSDCGEMTVSEDEITECSKCGSANVVQDPDVLDTWFSSALWPFSTLGWPDKTADFEYYYPTSVLVTAYDIITFWVSKMIFMGIENTEQIPFPDVFIHGLVRDAQGRKMSKSLGNGIDPLDVIEKYGADALRFALATGNAPGNDMRFSYEKMDAARNFNNKIWNAARFVRMNTESLNTLGLPDLSALKLEDKWILSLYNRLVGEVTNNIENYELGIALDKLYDFIWNVFCDWYIELLKPRLSEGDVDAQKCITYILSNTLKLLHPFMPFITEEIWQSLPHDGESIMVSEYPKVDSSLDFPDEEIEMSRLITAIRAIRNRRAEMNVAPGRKTKLTVVTQFTDTFNDDTGIFFKRLASTSEIEVKSEYSDNDAVQIVTDSATFFIPLADMIDFEAERTRLNKERDLIIADIERSEKKLANEGFISKAPANVIESEKNKLSAAKDKLTGIETAIEKLN
ncbi:MAG: valine--tRNA ligase [Eubacteriales bacterium]|jgi:valyl-tRNA synthetase